MSRALDLASGNLRKSARNYAAKLATAEQLMLACKNEDVARGISTGSGSAIELLAGEIKRSLDAINEAHDAGADLEAAAVRFARQRGRK